MAEVACYSGKAMLAVFLCGNAALPALAAEAHDIHCEMIHLIVFPFVFLLSVDGCCLNTQFRSARAQAA